MTLNRKKAQQLWKEAFGDKKVVKDYSGSYMYYEAYGKDKYYRKINGKNRQCGWNIDHILPKSKGGLTDKSNLACTNINTNRAKADKTTCRIGKNIYQVRRQNGVYTIDKIK